MSPHPIPCPPRQSFTQAVASQMTQGPELSANENHLSSSHAPRVMRRGCQAVHNWVNKMTFRSVFYKLTCLLWPWLNSLQISAGAFLWTVKQLAFRTVSVHLKRSRGVSVDR